MEKIEVGQVWKLKHSNEPVRITNIDGERVDMEWFWQDGKNTRDGITIGHFLSEFEFYAASMPYEKFKQWCVTGEEPKEQICKTR